MKRTATDFGSKKRGFTLLELLIVIGIIVVLASITVPAIKGLTKSNDNGQSVNLVRAMLSSARAIAVAQHRQAGVVFYEETSANAFPLNTGQTAMQVFVEDYNQAQYNPAQGNTVFLAYSSTRQYLPAGIKIATLNDGNNLLTGNNTSGANTRAIVFDADGNMITRNGLARPDLSGSPGAPPSGSAGTSGRVYGDWNFTTRGGNSSAGVSSPGFFVFSLSDYTAFQSIPANNTDAARTTWIKQNATPIIVNANTGMIIR